MRGAAMPRPKGEASGVAEAERKRRRTVAEAGLPHQKRRVFVAHCSTSTAIKLPLHIRSDYGSRFLIADPAVLSHEPARQRPVPPFIERPISGRCVCYLPDLRQRRLVGPWQVRLPHLRKRTCQDLRSISAEGHDRTKCITAHGDRRPGHIHHAERGRAERNRMCEREGSDGPQQNPTVA